MNVYRVLLSEIVDWFDEIMSHIPARTGSVVRTLVYSKRFRQIGHGSRIGWGFVVTNPGNISIGDDFHVLRDSCLYADGDGQIQIGHRVSLNSNVSIDASEKGCVQIGDDVLVGRNVVIRSSDHRFDNPAIPINKQGHDAGRIVIENDVWLGSNVVVVGGVTIGAHSVIGGGAVVTRDIAPYSVAVGVPARVVSNRNELQSSDRDQVRFGPNE